jgi:hypothetical protein
MSRIRRTVDRGALEEEAHRAGADISLTTLSRRILLILIVGAP